MIKSLLLISIPVLLKFSNLSIIFIVSCTKLYLPFNCFPLRIKLKIFLSKSPFNNLIHSVEGCVISFNWSNLFVTNCIQLRVESRNVDISKFVL